MPQLRLDDVNVGAFEHGPLSLDRSACLDVVVDIHMEEEQHVDTNVYMVGTNRLFSLSRVVEGRDQSVDVHVHVDEHLVDKLVDWCESVNDASHV